MSPVQRVLGDLRQRRLLPVVLLLVVAIVAVPVALSKPAPPPVPVPATPVVASVPGAATLPAVSVRAVGETPVKLNVRPHDPFVQGSIHKLRAAAAKAQAKAGATAKRASGSSTTSTKSSASGGSSQGTTTTSSTTTSVTSTTTAAPAPGTLRADQAYSVAIAITAGSGLNTIDPFERLGTLPTQSSPLLVELGVLQGGRRVLFAVMPGTDHSGPGRCIPGPVDCEIISLGLGEIEGLGRRTPTGSVPVAQFAVTAIRADDYAGAAAAARARHRASAAGAVLLRRSGLSALKLFPYDAETGVAVDERTLTTGTS